MLTVEAWAHSNSFDYKVLDDSFFEYAPQWFRDKAGNEICPVADLARLVLAKELMSQGYERTIWVDADMLVFDPENLVIHLERDFALCHEVWLSTSPTGGLQVDHRVNNSMAVFCRNNVHLDFFIDACLRIGASAPSIGKFDVGTSFLSRLHGIVPYPLLARVGMLNPVMMSEIVHGRPRQLTEYVQSLTSPLACANLCASLQGFSMDGVAATQSLYAEVVQVLLASRGNAINRLRRQGW
jgi:hypothetical protein